ncbi:MAG: hypothetical protein GKS02_01280 [Alphaproteobacteria bacterium]|nr:hypothetical protein [Alphaproteobacteria bacterium]
MSEKRIQRRLAAILVADVVGYSRLMGEDETGTHAAVKALHSEIFEPKIAEYTGRLVKTMGDGILVEFPSAVDAVEYAVEVQQLLTLQNKNIPNESQIRLRIGINLGDVIVDEDDLYGDGINIAARLEGLAEPDTIFVSEMAYSSVRNKIDVQFTAMGEHSLKNIVDPVKVYKVELETADPGMSDGQVSTAIFRRPAVAVLPFQNMSGDPEQEYLADGLTEDIITALSLWKSFPVIARNSTFSFKGQAPDIRKVGVELGARYVLEGSVRKAANRVRITAQLINSETGHHVWAERYDRDLADIFDLQDEITRRIVATLVPELERAEREKSATKPPANLDAWDLYLQGSAFMNDLAPDAVLHAREKFTHAIDLDPGYAKAHAKLALSYHRELWLNICEDPLEAAGTMLRHAQSAVRLDDSDSYSHAMHALALVWHNHVDQAVEELFRAITLNPIDIDANFTAGVALSWAGRPIEGIPHIEFALKISPHDPRSTMFYSQLAGAHFDANDFEAAAEWAQKALKASSNAAPNANTAFAILICLAALAHSDKSSEAKALAEQGEPIAQNFESADGLFRLRVNATTRSRVLEGLGMAGLTP